MNAKTWKIPAIIIAIGLIVALAAYFLTGILKTPTITEHDFHYTATYKLNGEIKTLEGVYRCQFLGTGRGTEPLERDYDGIYLSAPSEGAQEFHTIDRKDDLQLRIVFIFTPRYLMGDINRDDAYSDAIPEPYLAVYDAEGYEYHEPEKLEIFGAELISWETPQPIENTFVFSGFSRLHAGSMLVMLLAGLLTTIAVMIVIKRDKTVPYKLLDKISVVLNYLVCFVAIPFFTVVTALLPLTMSGDEFIYQVFLCIPAITAFTLAASIALRRQGRTKAGFFVQLTGPVLFFVPIILESFFYNIFG